tara:strand:+ start:3192 stop:3881 length:690 start_codon:yes stop_codon:yes gene_type:complete
MKTLFKTLMFILFLCLALIGSWALVHMPDRYKPWKPLQTIDEGGPFFKMKLSALSGDYDTCTTVLSRSDVDFEQVNDRQSGGCNLTDQIHLNRGLAPYSATVQGTCPLIVALSAWEDTVLAPAARRHFDSSVASITHYGIFSCRNVRGSTTRRSQHASANAIDIAAITLADGTRISVLDDWDDTNEKGAFLRDLHQGACGIFSGVLGPDYNALHRDHFHFDLGPYNLCR